MKLFLLVSCFVAVSIAGPLDDWVSFKAKFGKSYRNEKEEEFRRGIYLSTKQMIDEHNEKYRAGLVSYHMKMNHFGDKLQHEIIAINGLNGTEKFHNQNGLLFSSSSNVRAPSSVDWRKEGAVTDVKNQGSCGSCWAFSTTGSVEGQLFRKTGKLISLSEQNLVDCSEDYENAGCRGGLMTNAFDYIKDNGIEAEESYPYEAYEGECRYSESDSVTSLKGFVNIPAEDEDALKQAIAEVGPVSVAIRAGLRSFSFYSGGVYNDVACDDQLDHGVLAVGYGTENGQDYWLIKNSWGPTWGERGYVKIARNENNRCGVASMASYPLL